MTVRYADGKTRAAQYKTQEAIEAAAESGNKADIQRATKEGTKTVACVNSHRCLKHRRAWLLLLL
jgi:hypothetical protein